MPMPPLRHLLSTALLLLTCSVMAQNRPAAPRRAEPPASCLVSEFRGMALSTHDVLERGKQATEWMRRNASACSDEQLRLINSNRSAWLGTADSPQLMGLIEGALEARFKNKPELLAQMFASAPPRVAANETTRAGDLAPRPAPVVAPGTPAAVGTQVVVPMPGSPGAVPGNAPPAGQPLKPPEVGKHFNDTLRSAVREYFTANRGNGACPPGVILKSGRCEAAQSERSWKLGQALPGALTTKELPAPLLEKLGPTPAGHSYVQVDGDLLLINSATRTVIDSVLDLGQVAPKA